MTTVAVVMQATITGGTKVVGVYDDQALARRVVARHPDRWALTGPINREWGKPK